MIGQVAEHMADFGVECFVAHRDIAPSREWQNEIDSGLRTCHACVAMRHPGFHESNWCDQKIGYVLSRRVPFYPMSFDGALPYGFMGKFQAKRIWSGAGTADIAKLLMDWLMDVPTLQPIMTSGLVKALANSRSFDGTRRLMPYVDKIASFTEEQAASIRDTIAKNSQVWDASYRPEPFAPFRLVKDRLEEMLALHTAA